MEKACADGVGMDCASDDEGLGITGAEGRLSNVDRIASAKLLVSLLEGRRATYNGEIHIC